MAPSRRKDLVASRRRRQDDGEEEGSVVAELEDDSLSEGSIISQGDGDEDADVEPSDISEDDVARSQRLQQVTAEPNGSLPTEPRPKNSTSPAKGINFLATADTEAMLNGLKIADGKGAPEIHFGQSTADTTEYVSEDAGAPSKVPKQETLAERNRREHLEYLKQRSENPAFVPTRGGFFLHDNRAAASGTNGFRVPTRGRGRGFTNGFHSAYVFFILAIDW
jgi:CASC3/Barentsz eIF4AIII binding